MSCASNFNVKQLLVSDCTILYRLWADFPSPNCKTNTAHFSYSETIELWDAGLLLSLYIREMKMGRGLRFVCQDVCMWTCIPKELRDCSWECNEAGANERQSCERKVGGRAGKPWRQLKLPSPPSSPFASWPSLGGLSLLVWTEEADQVILKFRSAKETSESGLWFQCTECLWDKGMAGFCVALFCCKSQRQPWQGLKGWIDTNDAFSTWQLVG